MEYAVRLKPGRERAVLRRHPWLFSGAIQELIGGPAPGDVLEVYDSQGTWLARGAFSPHSQIRVRIWTWDPDEAVDTSLLRRRILQAIERRERLAAQAGVSAYREIYAEADGIPGLIVDRYGEHRVVQFLTSGVEAWREEITNILAGIGECRGLMERSGAEGRELEGLSPRAGLLWGEPPPQNHMIEEYGLRFFVDISSGQKTGFYLDQRENRRTVKRWLPGGQVLDAFAYTGGFTVAALAAGAAHVVSIDQSEDALALLRRNVELNAGDAGQCEWQQEDVFAALRSMRDAGRTFDAIILDPPRFAQTESQAQRAARGYKDINLLAFKLLRPGGLLFTFSCSGGVSPELFQKIVAGAALDAEVDANVVEWLGQPADHPVALNFPESRYLKGLVCRVR